MKPSQVIIALKTCIAARRPAMIWGPPAVGKSAIARQTALELGLEFLDIRAVLLDPVDLRGLPTVKDGMSHWAIPDFLPRTGRGLILIDEINSAPRLVQAGLFQLILDRKSGEYEVPDGWDIIAAGNNDKDGGVTERMPTPLKSRFVHLNFQPDLNDWTQWALSAGIALEVIGFIRFKRELFHAFSKDTQTFPAPRTWQFVSDILQSNPDKSIERELYEGCVGPGAAVEFLAYLQICRELPSPDSILLNPSSADVPTSPGVLYALAGSLARAVTTANSDAMFTYAARLSPEFSVIMVQDATRRCPAIQNSRAFIQWAADNAAVMT